MMEPATLEWKRGETLHLTTPTCNVLAIIHDPSVHHQHAQYSVMVFISTIGENPKRQHSCALAYTHEEARSLVDDLIGVAYERAMVNPMSETVFHQAIATYVQGALL